MHLVYNVKYAYLCVYLMKEIKSGSFLKTFCEALYVLGHLKSWYWQTECAYGVFLYEWGFYILISS
jgi:hypothetical protein